MKWLFALAAVGFVLLALVVMGLARGAMHEMLAGLLLLSAVLCAVASALLGALHRTRREVTAHLEELTRRVPAPEGNPAWLRSADKPGA